MEDFYETSISEVDGQMVAFFAVFDGMSHIILIYSINIIFPFVLS